MTTVKVSEYSDLRGDRVLPGSRAKDAIVSALADGADGVIYLDDWLTSEKDLEYMDECGQLARIRLLHETEKAFIVGQGRDANGEPLRETAVPKSCSRLYIPRNSSEDVAPDVPQRGLDDYL